MKIVFFVHCFFPDHFYGTETYTLGLARHYQSWGHDVTVVSAVFQGEPRQPGLVTRYVHDGVPVIAIDKNHIPHTRVKETYYQQEVNVVLEKILLELRPDIVHVTHLINHTSVLLEVVEKLGIATYATFTDFFGFCLTNKLEAANGDLCAGPSASRANCVACHLKEAARSPNAAPWMRRACNPRVATLMAKGAMLARRLPGLRRGPMDGLIEDIVARPGTLAQLYNRSYKGAVAPTQFLKKAYIANQIRVPLHNIWFGIDIDRSAKPRRRQGHIPVVAFIGQIAPHKGTDLLIQAFRRLPPRSAELRIYGPPDQSPAYMADLISMAEGAEVCFMGTFDSERMADVLRQIDLLVIPSRWYENSPLVLLSSLATHTPVLVSDVEGMTEFVTDGVDGASFQRGSANDLESKLRALLGSADSLAELSSTTNYERTTEIMARETFGLYAS